VWPDNLTRVSLGFDLTWEARPAVADGHGESSDHGDAPDLALQIRRWKERTVEDPEALIVSLDLPDASTLPEGDRSVRVDLPKPGRYEIRLVATDGSFSAHTISVRAERSGATRRQTTREQVTGALDGADPLLTQVLTYALDSLDLEGIDTVVHRHARRRLYYRKYLDVPRGLARQIPPLSRAGLLERPPGAAVLDLGSGAGHCLLVCQALGHRAVGIDIPDEIFDDLAAVLSLDRVIAWIRPDKPLPVDGQRFDLIHSLNAEFFILPADLMVNPAAAEEAWRAEHWAVFAEHLRDALAPGGLAYLFLNDRPLDRGLVPSSPDFAPTLSALGFEVSGRLVQLRAPR
jgi:SAM-dependent methyltransferase